jgi:membrane-associated phospholipid phosphatase
MVSQLIKKNISESVRDITSFGSPIILIILSSLIIGINFILFKIILGLIAIEILGSAIKFFYSKERPHKEAHSNFLEKIDARSFPSLHVARSSFIFLTLFFLLNALYIKILLIILMFLVGTSRIILKKHDLQDVLGGIIMGIGISILWKIFII